LELSTDGTSTPGLVSRRLQAAVEDSFIFVDVGILQLVFAIKWV